MPTTLAVYLRERMLKDKMSARRASREAGVAHTTIMRILDGKEVSVDTLEKVCEFLEINPGDVIGPGGISEISSILSQEPELEQVFTLALKKLHDGEISQDTIREIIRYTSWRLELGGRTDEHQPNADVGAKSTAGGNHIS
jgi:DNA-binding Xre family transcriptional regulator